MKIDRNPFHSLVAKSMFEDKDTGTMLNEMSEMVEKSITFNEVDFPYWAIVFDTLSDTIKSQMDEEMFGIYDETRKDLEVVTIKKEGKK